MTVLYPYSMRLYLFFFAFWKVNAVNFLRRCDIIIMLSQILRDDPVSPEALIGRGTAYAFQRKLDVAISDFTKVKQEFSVLC